MSDYIGSNYGSGNNLLGYLRSIVPSAKYIFNTTMQDNFDPNVQGTASIRQQQNQRTNDAALGDILGQVSKLSPMQKLKFLQMTQTNMNPTQGAPSAMAQAPQDF